MFPTCRLTRQRCFRNVLKSQVWLNSRQHCCTWTRSAPPRDCRSPRKPFRREHSHWKMRQHAVPSACPEKLASKRTTLFLEVEFYFVKRLIRHPTFVANKRRQVETVTYRLCKIRLVQCKLSHHFD